MLSGKLEEQLKKWAQIKTDEVPKVNAQIKQVDLPALIIKERRPRRKEIASSCPRCICPVRRKEG